MAKYIDTLINSFNGGVSNDPRDTVSNVARMVSNFDILTDKHKLIPYPSSEDGNGTQSGDKIKNFCIAKLNSTPTYALYGLGISGTGTNRAKVFYKNLTTGSTYDLDDDDWNATDNPESAANSSGLSPECFVYYEKQGLIYMVDKANSQIMAYDPDGGTAWSEASQAITVSLGVGQGIVASDDILYIPYDNYVASKDGAGAWNLTALTLPTQLRVRSICEYGNYLAIACEPNSGATPGFGGSKVFLWDKTSESWSDLIDWGQERLLVLDEVNGTLVGISIGTGATRLIQRIIFRYLSVSSAVKFFELTASTTGIDLINFSRRLNSRLYFMAEITIDGVSRNGVWSVGGRPGDFTVVHERTTNNDGTFTDLELFGFHIVGDYMFISYADTVAAVTTNYLVKTQASTYSATAIFERMLIAPDSSVYKKLVGVDILTEPLPAGASVTAKYKRDAETSWTTIFTNAVDDSINHPAVNIESTGVNLGEYQELSIRAESTGGAVITGIRARSEIIDRAIF